VEPNKRAPTRRSACELRPAIGSCGRAERVGMHENLVPRRELAVDQGLADGLGRGVGLLDPLLSTLQSPYLPTASNWTDASGMAAM
jgi:hypothetical protein